MEYRKQNLILIVSTISLFFFFFNCQSKHSKTKINLFESCIESFKDEVKCYQFLSKIGSSPPAQNKLDDDVREKNLYIRNELKDLLDTKSKSFVIEKLGEPEEKYTDGSGREFFKYTRPISRYSPNHDPDIEILIVIKRGFVNKVIHKKSETTP